MQQTLIDLGFTEYDGLFNKHINGFDLWVELPFDLIAAFIFTDNRIYFEGVNSLGELKILMILMGDNGL